MVESEIAKWYGGKAVFVTGATGFMGRILLEKLLRSCPEVGPIYVLVREKKNIQSNDRVDDMLTSHLFNLFHATGVSPRDRLITIPGDISLPDLGISVENKRLLQETVSVVFHLAATVRFDEALRIAVSINQEGTRTLLELCRQMANLSAFVHVSTAYTNCNLSTIDERVYPPPADPGQILHCVAGMDDDMLEFVMPRLIGHHPNTYTFTKAIAEHVVAGYSTELPIVVVRPSIVSATWREPVPGWVDNFNGPTGLVVGVGKGLLKSMYGKSGFVADLVPVDVCINLCIAAAWEIGTRKSPSLVPNVRVYNCVSRPFKSLLWNEFVQEVDRCSKKYAMSNVFSSPKIRMTDSRVKQVLHSIFEHTLPAILADVYFRLLGKTPRFNRYQSKLKKMAALLEFFTSHEFQFNVENVEELKRRLNSADQELFNFDLTKINWQEYVVTYFLGIRKYLMKEDDATIRASKRHVSRWNLLEKVIPIGFFTFIVISYFRMYHSFSH